jgi:nuclear cap-binding protein subunit 1
MSKHVNRLGRELAEALERLRHAESDSDESEDGDGEGNNNSSQRGKSGGGDDREKPSEDMVDRMEERLEAAQADQKNLFLIIFQARLSSCVIIQKQLVPCKQQMNFLLYIEFWAAFLYQLSFVIFSEIHNDFI